MRLLRQDIQVETGSEVLPVSITANPQTPHIERISLGRPASNVTIILGGDNDAILGTLRNLGVAVAEAILRRSSEAALAVVAEAVNA